MDHDPSDQVGVVESVRIDADRVARAVVRFSRSQQDREIFNDVIDGIRKNISVGYFVNDMIAEPQTNTETSKEATTDTDAYRITAWEPFEISIVSVPADPTVGIGRAMSELPTTIPIPNTQEQPATMTEPANLTTPPLTAPQQAPPTPCRRTHPHSNPY